MRRLALSAPHAARGGGGAHVADAPGGGTAAAHLRLPPPQERQRRHASWGYAPSSFDLGPRRTPDGTHDRDVADFLRWTLGTVQHVRVGQQRSAALAGALKSEMQRLKEAGYEVGPATYAQAVTLLARWGRTIEARQMMEEMKQKGQIESSEPYEELIKGHAMCGDLLGIQQVIREMHNDGWAITKQAYNYLLMGFSKRGEQGHAIAVLQAMKDHGLQPDRMSYHWAIMACNNYPAAQKVFEDMCDRGIQYNDQTFAALLKTCVKAGDARAGVKIITESIEDGLKPSATVFNQVLRLLLKPLDMNGIAVLYRKMRQLEIPPDFVTFCIFIRACKLECRGGVKVDQRPITLAEAAIDQARRDGVDHREVYRELLSLYNKVGDRRKAEEVASLMLKALPGDNRRGPNPVVRHPDAPAPAGPPFRRGVTHPLTAMPAPAADDWRQQAADAMRDACGGRCTPLYGFALAHNEAGELAARRAGGASPIAAPAAGDATPRSSRAGAARHSSKLHRGAGQWVQWTNAGRGNGTTAHTLQHNVARDVSGREPAGERAGSPLRGVAPRDTKSSRLRRLHTQPYSQQGGGADGDAADMHTPRDGPRAARDGDTVVVPLDFDAAVDLHAGDTDSAADGSSRGGADPFQPPPPPPVVTVAHHKHTAGVAVAAGKVAATRVEAPATPPTQARGHATTTAAASRGPPHGGGGGAAERRPRSSRMPSPGGGGGAPIGDVYFDIDTPLGASTDPFAAADLAEAQATTAALRQLRDAAAAGSRVTARVAAPRTRLGQLVSPGAVGRRDRGAGWSYDVPAAGEAVPQVHAPPVAEAAEVGTTAAPAETCRIVHPVDPVFTAASYAHWADATHEPPPAGTVHVGGFRVGHPPTPVADATAAPVFENNGKKDPPLKSRRRDGVGGAGGGHVRGLYADGGAADAVSDDDQFQEPLDDDAVAARVRTAWREGARSLYSNGATTGAGHAPSCAHRAAGGTTTSTTTTTIAAPLPPWAEKIATRQRREALEERRRRQRGGGACLSSASGAGDMFLQALHGTSDGEESGGEGGGGGSATHAPHTPAGQPEANPEERANPTAGRGEVEEVDGAPTAAAAAVIGDTPRSDGAQDNDHEPPPPGTAAPEPAARGELDDGFVGVEPAAAAEWGGGQEDIAKPADDATSSGVFVTSEGVTPTTQHEGTADTSFVSSPGADPFDIAARRSNASPLSTLRFIPRSPPSDAGVQGFALAAARAGEGTPPRGNAAADTTDTDHHQPSPKPEEPRRPAVQHPPQRRPVASDCPQE